MTALAILDLGYGNTDSIRLAFQRLGVEATLTADPGSAARAERLVLPGVGAAGFAMQRLDQTGLADVLRRRTAPTLGICLGMQLLFDSTEEGDVAGLGLIPGRVQRLRPRQGLPVPHMGWSRLDRADPATGLSVGDYVYFAHGFACPNGDTTSAATTYGLPIAAALRRGPLWGAQFHPERSSAPGAAFLAAFLAA